MDEHQQPILDTPPALLGRLDERTEKMGKIMDEIKESIREMSGVFVRREEFIPVKNIVYGLAGFILLGFMSAVGYYVFQH